MTEIKGIGLTGRINYYQPFDKVRKGEDSAYAFYGNGIYGAGVEEAMTGLDYEAGVRIPFVSNYVETWAYAGGYNFFGSHVPDVNGFSARIEAIPTDFMRLNFEYRNDNVDHDQFYGEVAFEVPFSVGNLVTGKNPFEGLGSRIGGTRDLKGRMVEPVRRDVDIVVKDGALSPEEAAANGDMAAGAIFVSDNAPTGGDGSFEHPYNNLGDAANDLRLGNTISIVHVLPGNGSGLSGETFNQAGITIWGAGAANPAFPNVVNFVQGWPLVYSTLSMGGPNMKVLGLNLDVSNYSAIEVQTGALSTGFSIFSNRISNHGGIYGIHAEGLGDVGAPGAPAIISGNSITVGSGNGLNAAIGTYLESYEGNIYARILNNAITDLEGEYHAAGIEVTADSGDFIGSISGNTISGIYSGGESYGIYVGAGNDFRGDISGNRISDIDAFDNYGISAIGIYVGADNNMAASISGNTVSGIYADYADGAYASGISVEANDGDVTGSITGNTVSDVSASDAYRTEASGIDAYADGDFTGSITGNRVSGIHAGPAEEAYASGISAEADNGDFTGSITGNAVSDVSASDAYDAEAYGIYIYADGDFTGSISKNTVSGIYADSNGEAYAYGIYGYANGDFPGSISKNTITGVSADGADWGSANGIEADTDGMFGGSISGNKISGVDGWDNAAGIRLSANDDITGSITNNLLEVTAEYDAYGLIAGTSGSLGTASSPLIFTGNSGTVNALAAYMAYLYTGTPSTSSVYIGHGHDDMGDNHFSTTGAWAGNYPGSGGRIWAEWYPGFNYIHP